MTLTIRPAVLDDIDAISELLLKDARQRCAANPGLWKLSAEPQYKIKTSITAAMQSEASPIRQKWIVAEAEGKAVGIAHSILLPVPPIYAGEFGPPGLIMEDCFVARDAPPETPGALLEAAEADLIEAGAQILLASSIQSGAWADQYKLGGYDPLTLYLAKSGLGQAEMSANLRRATQQDIAGIVASSATHRSILEDLHALFWKPHAEADTRFGAWMTRSLTLTDRDMYVSANDGIGGYAISQPATPLHFPNPHDISGVGVIDDFYHDALRDPALLGEEKGDAKALIAAAEAARSARGDTSVLVVCPAAWTSKIDLLQQAGYRKAIIWFIKMPSGGKD